MENFEPDSDAFLVQLPLYFIMEPSPDDASEETNNGKAMTIHLAGGIRALAIFTDDDLVQRFIQDNGLSGTNRTIAGFHDPEPVLHLLKASQALGVEYISPDPIKAGRPAWCTNIVQLIDSLEREVAECDDDE